MTNKRKFVIQPKYGPMMGCLLLAVVHWFIPPSRFSYSAPREVTVAFVIYILLVLGKHYSFSEEGIKVYILGIRIRNIPWTAVKSLIHISDQSSIRKNHKEEFLVVEKLNCDSSFPVEDGSTWKARIFLSMNLTRAFKIILDDSKFQTQIEGIEQFHKIDESYLW